MILYLSEVLPPVLRILMTHCLKTFENANKNMIEKMFENANSHQRKKCWQIHF